MENFEKEEIVFDSVTLKKLTEEAKPFILDGKVADYIPALAKMDQSDIAVGAFLPDGRFFSAGNDRRLFTLQSVSKVVTLAMAIMSHGEEYVFDRVGMEPTGDPFNSIVKLERVSAGKPLNPMINAGALAVTSMIEGVDVKDRLARLIGFIRLLVDDQSVGYCEEVARSEFETGHRNRSLCYFMKAHNIIKEGVDELMDLYTKQCAIEMNVVQLARLGLIFAFDGWDPIRKTQLIPKKIAQICNTFMVTCGMYDASGEFAIKVGIPAKSGVSGAIMGAVPRKLGLSVYGPALNAKGNSVAGLFMLEQLSNRLDLSIF